VRRSLILLIVPTPYRFTRGDNIIRSQYKGQHPIVVSEALGFGGVNMEAIEFEHNLVIEDEFDAL
jgi:hypothetical protein